MSESTGGRIRVLVAAIAFGLLCLLGYVAVHSREIFQTLAEVSEVNHPTLDEVDSSRFFLGSTDVSDNLSYSTPAQQPCDRTSTATFFEQMRKRQCSVILVVSDRFLFWGWVQPRRSTLGTNVESAALEIQNRVGRKFIETYSGKLSTNTILAGLDSEIPIVDKAPSSTIKNDKRTEGIIKSPQVETSASLWKDGEFYPQESDRATIPGFDHLLISPRVSRTSPDEADITFMVGPTRYTCSGATITHGNFSCRTQFSEGVSYHLIGTFLLKSDTSNSGSPSVVSLVVAEDTGVQESVHPAILLKFWEGD